MELKRSQVNSRKFEDLHIFLSQLSLDLRKNYVYMLIIGTFLFLIQILPFILNFMDPATLAKSGGTKVSNAGFLIATQNFFISPLIIAMSFFLLYNIFSTLCEKNAVDFWYSLPAKSYVVNAGRICAALICQIFPLLIHAFAMRLYFGAGKSKYYLDQLEGNLLYTPWTSYAPRYFSLIPGIVAFTLFSILIYAWAGKASDGIKINLSFSLLSFVVLIWPIKVNTVSADISHYNRFIPDLLIDNMQRALIPEVLLYSNTEEDSIFSIIYVPIIFFIGLYALSKRPSEIAEQPLMQHGKFSLLEFYMILVYVAAGSWLFDWFIESVFDLKLIGGIFGAIFAYFLSHVIFGGKLRQMTRMCHVISGILGYLLYIYYIKINANLI